MKNPITFFLFSAFLFANLVDIVTAFFIKPGETNPLYLLTGNLWMLILLKIAVVWAMYYWINRNIFPNNFTYYVIMLLLVLGTLLVSLGVASNIYGMLHPNVIEEGAKMATGEKAKAYTIFVSVIYFIPALFNLLIFWLYDKSFKKVKIDKEYFSKLPWWHF